MIGLLASKRTRLQNPELIRAMLKDSDSDIRGAALIWAAETMDTGLVESLGQAIRHGRVTAELFELYLSANEVLDPAFVEAYQTKSNRKASSIQRRLEPRLLTSVIVNPDFSDAVRALAIRRLSSGAVNELAPQLRQMVRSGGDPSSIAAMDSLIRFQSMMQTDWSPLLLAVAQDNSRTDRVRTHAIAAVAKIPDANREAFSDLIADPSPVVAEQARRLMSEVEETNLAAGEVAKAISGPSDRKVLAEGGSPLLGRHVFFSDRVGCHRCHALDGRGRTLGPALNQVARSKSREQIVDSILNPSAQYAPQYQAWMVLTTEGKLYRGLQLDHKAKGAIAMTLESGEDRFFSGEEIESYRALPKSLMPEGQAELMSDEEWRDLIAFLMSLRG